MNRSDFKVTECSKAVAEAIKLCRPAVIPIYPITPQTHIPEKIADFVNDGELDSELIHVESEHSAISSAVGASATGVRTYTATASQGLALMHEILFVASGSRLPIVMSIANRALSCPINIWNDHQDSISARDTGWMQFYVESAQEAFDTSIFAFKIAEKMFTPAMVCIDGFTLTHVYEPVNLENQQKVKRFLPDYSPKYWLDTKNPLTFGPIGYPEQYIVFKKQQQDAMMQALKEIPKMSLEFKKIFGRSYGDGLIDPYKTKDADVIFICMGTIAGTARTVIDDLRKKGKKVGMARIRCYRPFPEESLRKALSNAKKIIVFDKNISLGHEGAVATEIKALYSGDKKKIKGYVVGLGGRDITEKTFLKAYEDFDKKDDGWIL